MKRFRMKKQKIVKPDGRWLYLYTFEELPEQGQEEANPSQPNPAPAEKPAGS